MPNQMMPWDEVTNRSNPTCSTKINKLIKAMIKKEVARLGKKSQARRPFEQNKFEALIEAISHGNDTSVVIWLVLYIIFQYIMMARVDDTAKFRRPDLKPFQAYPDYGLLAKL